MKTIAIILVWLIGISAIFVVMLEGLNLRNYFPFGLLAIYIWSFLVYKATHFDEQ